MNVNLIRFILSAILIVSGILVMIISTFGVYRIRYVMNRLHSAAMGDSLGIGLILSGLVVLYGISYTSLKILIILSIFWLAAPVCSHLLSFLEISTNEQLDRYCGRLQLKESEEGGEEK